MPGTRPAALAHSEDGPKLGRCDQLPARALATALVAAESGPAPYKTKSVVGKSAFAGCGKCQLYLSSTVCTLAPARCRKPRSRLLTTLKATSAGTPSPSHECERERERFRPDNAVAAGKADTDMGRRPQVQLHVQACVVARGVAVCPQAAAAVPALFGPWCGASSGASSVALRVPRGAEVVGAPWYGALAGAEAGAAVPPPAVPASAGLAVTS